MQREHPPCEACLPHGIIEDALATFYGDEDHDGQPCPGHNLCVNHALIWTAPHVLTVLAELFFGILDRCDGDKNMAALIMASIHSAIAHGHGELLFTDPERLPEDLKEKVAAALLQRKIMGGDIGPEDFIA